MNPTLSALLRGCKDEPFDDSARLILADWLEEHGEGERAEFVRLGVLLARLWGDEPDAIAQEARRDRLFLDNREHWLGPAGGWYNNVSFERGLIRIDATPQQLLAHPPTDLPPHVLPWVEELYLCMEAVDGLDDFLSSSLLRCFSRVEIGGFGRPELNDGHVKRLAANPALEEMRHLRLAYNQITAEGVRSLVRCERLAGLRGLDLYTNPLRDAGAAALAEAPWLAGITWLNLGDTEIDAKGLSAIFKSKHLGTLTHLGLSKIRFTRSAARAVANAPSLANLKSLGLECAELEDMEAIAILADSPHLRPHDIDFFFVPLGEVGAAALAKGSLLSRVRELKLCSNRFTVETTCKLLSSEQLGEVSFLQLWDALGDAGCEVLAKAEHFSNLRRLSLHDAGIERAGATTLGRSKTLAGLVTLSLDENAIGPSGVRGLAKGLPALETLSLNETKLQKPGVQALVESGMMARLKRIDLSNNGLSDRAMVVLSKVGADARLTELDVCGNRIGRHGAKALANCAGLSNLVQLRMYDNKVGDRGIDAIVRSTTLTGLVGLDVRENGLTHAAAKQLLEWSRRPVMLRLWVEDKAIHDDFAEQVSIGRL